MGRNAEGSWRGRFAWQNSSELSDHGGSPDDVGAQGYPDRARPFLIKEGLEFGLAAMTAVAAGD